jgi:hypothetical protein
VRWFPFSVQASETLEGTPSAERRRRKSLRIC